MPVPARPDSIRVDTAVSVVPMPHDTTRKVPRDTIKTPTARAEVPALIEVGPTYRWNREALFGSGALTLLDFLERIPGLTGLRAGWINEPQLAAYLGQVGAVRVFYDGLEMDPLNPRSPGAIDLSQIQLWTLEEIAIERGADEVRVYLRSWRTDRTTPQTRVDVSTGDQGTNLYRGFYGKRFKHGEALQAAFQQFSTREPHFGGDGDEVSLFVRGGWAHGNWSFDGLANRVQRRQTDRGRYPPGVWDDLPALRGRTTNGFLRAAYGDPDRSPFWAQLIAGTLGFDERSPHRPGNAQLGIVADSADTTRSEGQYVAALGLTRGAARLSGTGRFRSIGGRFYSSGMARASFDRRVFGVSLLGERDGVDSLWRAEGTLRVQPFPVLALSGAASYVTPDADTHRPKSFNLRGEAALRFFGGLWVGGGVMVRDSALLRPPSVFDAAFLPFLDGPNTGGFVRVRGQLYKAFYADAYGVTWKEQGVYRPADESHADVGIRTNWLSRFPSGHFGFHLAAIHHYRGPAYFPLLTTNSSNEQAVALARVRPSQAVDLLLEIRIVSATLTYQLRNALGAQFDVVPGYLQPRTVNFYGVRWDFAN